MKTWTTKDGTEIKIKDLDTSHLKNIIALLEKRAEGGVVCSWKKSYDSGYDGDSYVPDFIMVESTLHGTDYLKHTCYKELVKELKSRA